MLCQVPFPCYLRALFLRIPNETFQPETECTVRCKQKLGGIIKTYYREAV
jgi:hypothetical protein